MHVYHHCQINQGYLPPPYPCTGRKKPPVFCANCGGYGHVYKNCNHPIISYGVICYKPFYDRDTNSVYPKYLMVQRKDSLCYVEFIRGKYEIENKDYIMKLFSHMTEEERAHIYAHKDDFEALWNSMWCRGANSSPSENTKNFNRECKEATERFQALSAGYTLVNPDTGESTFFDLEYVLHNTHSIYNETEWGFPKGRRNINEDDISCAVREFREETGIPTRNIRINRDIKPLEEVFTGSNKVRYKHVYYVARYNPQKHEVYPTSATDPHYDPLNILQSKEVKDVQWFSYQEAQDKIRDCNVERKELFKRLNQIIIKSYHYV